MTGLKKATRLALLPASDTRRRFVYYREPRYLTRRYVTGVPLVAPTQVPVTFSGGHDTDQQDHGRPIVLIAAELEVKPEVFREAFSGVAPAGDHKPSSEDARRHQAALMKVAQPPGVTNNRLGEVPNHSRQPPQKSPL